MICSYNIIYNDCSQSKKVIKLKTIFIGEGVAYFKKKQGLKWRDIQVMLDYKSPISTGNLTQVASGSTNLVDKLANVFGVTPSEFIKQCEVDEVKK